MATKKQTQAAKKNVRKATKAAEKKRSLANMPKATKTALASREPRSRSASAPGRTAPTPVELYEEAKRRNLKGRSKMGRDAARALGHG